MPGSLCSSGSPPPRSRRRSPAPRRPSRTAVPARPPWTPTPYTAATVAQALPFSPSCTPDPIWAETSVCSKHNEPVRLGSTSALELERLPPSGGGARTALPLPRPGTELPTDERHQHREEGADDRHDHDAHVHL